MKTPKGWQPMRTAPRDGTIILVCETPNSEHWNVMPASYQRHMGVDSLEGFWGVGVTSRLPHPPYMQQELPADFKALAITPLCWQPMPELEDVGKLRRRASQIYAAKFRK